MTDKALILDAIQKLPDDSTVNDIREQLDEIGEAIARKICRGLSVPPVR